MYLRYTVIKQFRLLAWIRIHPQLEIGPKVKHFDHLLPKVRGLNSFQHHQLGLREHFNSQWEFNGISLRGQPLEHFIGLLFSIRNNLVVLAHQQMQRVGHFILSLH